MQVDVVIEIPGGSRNKYEVDKQTGRVRLDRVLFSSYHYPTDYGYVPETLAQDGDPIDVLVVMHEPTFPGCVVGSRPIGVLWMTDDAGPDEKVLAVPVADPRFDEVYRLSHLAPHWLREIENFFSTYKMLEKKDVTLNGWGDTADAERVIKESHARYREQAAAGG